MEAYGIDKLEREKTNEEVLGFVKEKRTFMDTIRARRWKMVGYAKRYSAEPHNIILEELLRNWKTSNWLEWRILNIHQPTGW